jgi:hypothetical protein
MNSGRTNLAVEQSFEPYLERAKLFAGSDVRVVGSGRWMLTTCHDAKRCFLFETAEEARRHVSCKHCFVTDLASSTPRERQEEIELRAERRAKRNVEALKAAQAAQGLAR